MWIMWLREHPWMMGRRRRWLRLPAIAGFGAVATAGGVLAPYRVLGRVPAHTRMTRVPVVMAKVRA
jgi:hypothetical protein